MEVEFDVKIDSAVLYDYMLHHTYTSFAGVVGTTVGALILVAFGMTGHVVYLIAGLIILLYQPGSLLLKAKQQALTNPAFKQPLHYKMTEEGVEVSQGGYGGIPEVGGYGEGDFHRQEHYPLYNQNQCEYFSPQGFKG